MPTHTRCAPNVPSSTVCREARRTGALLTFLLQLVMVAVLPAVHALSERENLRHVTHVEAENDGTPCPTSHEDACATCRGLHHAAVLTVIARLTSTETVGHERVVRISNTVTRPLIASGSLGSRAPPIA